MLRRFTAIFLALTLLCTISAAAAEGSRYSDVPDNWTRASIEKATDYGLINGIGGGQFGYGQQMNRASFAVILCRMLGWAEERPAAPSYPDVAEDYWAYGSIEAALTHGVLDPAGAFRPDASITREEMAVMLMRALDYDQLAADLEGADLPFEDVKTNRGYITLAYRCGIITGGVTDSGKRCFFPNQPAPREQVAAMLVRVYERYYAKIDWLHGFYAFNSYPQIGLTAKMDAVSVGWARLDADEAGVPFLNQTTKNNNEWTIPAGADLATGTFGTNGTPYNLSVFADGDDLASLLATGESRARGVAAIAAAVGPYNGITIDFEGLRTDKRESFTAFMTALRAALPAGKALWAAVQTPDWFGGYDYRALGDVCGKVILMAHDYKWNSIPASYVGASTPNPVSPFPSVFSALAAITDPDTGVRDKGKIALAIAIDSAGYEVDKEGRIAATTLYSPAVDTLSKRLRQADAVRGWSDVYRNPYITYTGDDSKTYRVWYEDARSALEKVRLAALFGVNGVSLWRLGNLPQDPDPNLNYDVWSALLTRR